MATQKSSKKNHLQGINIVHEDRDIIVINKHNGLLSIGTEKDKYNTAHFILNEYVKRGNPKSKERVFIVHRLDRDTSGLLVFARSEKAKRFLQDNWADFGKKYVAMIYGVPKVKEGVIESYLAENRQHQIFSTDDATQGKYAKTAYKILKEEGKYSLVELELFTGRKHQIRVHLSDLGHPIVGDRLYARKDPSIRYMALHSYELTIVHPFSRKEMTFKTEIPKYFQYQVSPKPQSQKPKKD